MKKKWINPVELLEILPFSKPTLYRRLKDGTIPCIRIGGRIFIDEEELDEILKPKVGVYKIRVGGYCLSVTAEEILQLILDFAARAERIERKVDALLEGQDSSEFVTVSDIAREVGRTRQWVHVNPWILPGPADIDGKPKQWLRAKWDQHKQDLFDLLRIGDHSNHIHG